MVEEDTTLRENTILRFYEVSRNEDMDRILKGIETLMRNKRITILLMGGNYEEVQKETK